MFTGTRIAYNAATNRPLAEGAQADVARGALVGAGTGVLASATGVVTAGTAEAGTATAGAAGSRADAIAKLRELGPEAVQGLRAFFKSGTLPGGLSPEALQRYRTVAENAVRAGLDKSGEQARRIQMIDDVLNKNQ